MIVVVLVVVEDVVVELASLVSPSWAMLGFGKAEASIPDSNIAVNKRLDNDVWEFCAIVDFFILFSMIDVNLLTYNGWAKIREQQRGETLSSERVRQALDHLRVCREQSFARVPFLHRREN